MMSCAKKKKNFQSCDYYKSQFSQNLFQSKLMYNCQIRELERTQPCFGTCVVTV